MKIILGKVVKTFGIKGELKIHSNTDFASYRYKKGNEIILFSPITNTSETFKVKTHRTDKNSDIVLFEGITNPDVALKYIGYQVLIEKPDNEFEDGIYHYADLWHCEIIYQNEVIGKVIDMINSVSYITLRVKREGKKDLLYPFVEKFIENVDIENKKIYIKPIAGMLELWR